MRYFFLLIFTVSGSIFSQNTQDTVITKNNTVHHKTSIGDSITSRLDTVIIDKKPLVTDKSKKISEDSIIIDNGKPDSLIIFRPTIADYQFKTEKSIKKVFDTVLSYDKTFIFSQFNNKNNFGKVQFPNSGQTFNTLIYEPNYHQNLALFPTGKSFNIIPIDSIKYYDVKTPTTAFIFHTAPEKGTVLNSTYTQNIGKNFNFTVEYFGLRSEGLYQRNLSASNNVNIGISYKNKRYELYAHYLSQNVNNEENGGIKVLNQFLGRDSRFNNRKNIEVNLMGSESLFNYRRYYLSHSLGLFKVNEVYPIKIKHKFVYEGNKYYFIQNRLENMYAQNDNVLSFFTNSSKKYSKKTSHVISMFFDNEKFKLDAGLKYENMIFGVNQIFLTKISDPYIKDDRGGFEGNMEIKLWDKFDLTSYAEYTHGKKFGNFFRINNNLEFTPVKGYSLDAKLNFISSSPPLNLLMNGSIYRKFNYANYSFKQQSILETGGLIKFKFLNTSIFANYFNILNYSYLNSESRMLQSSSPINISQVGGEITLKYNKFRLNGRGIFQSVLNNKNLLPLPKFVGRTNLYFQSKAFTNAEIQTGLKVYFFSTFRSREFLPVVNEFILPSSSSHYIGGNPIADIYFNLKVKSMMIFIEGQHINTTFSQNKSFAAPYYPVTDFRLNIGIVWYIFS